MVDKKAKAVRVCDSCGETYIGEGYEPYGEQLCDACAKPAELPLITEDQDDSEIPDSVHDEFDFGGEDDGD